MLEKLPKFGTYSCSIDLSLIKQYSALIRDTINRENSSKQEFSLVTQIAYLILRGNAYRNSSSDSRWKNYGKQEIVKTLSENDKGMAILYYIARQDPQLEDEIEAFLLDDEIA